MTINIMKTLPILASFLLLGVYINQQIQKLHPTQKYLIKSLISNNESENIIFVCNSIIKNWNEDIQQSNINISITLNSKNQINSSTLNSFKQKYGDILDVVTKNASRTFSNNSVQVLIIFTKNLDIGEAIITFQQKENIVMEIDADSFFSYFNFINTNKEQGTTGFSMIQNSQKVLDINGNSQMVLQGIEKSLTALEFAIQVGNGQINPAQLINISSIAKFIQPCSYQEWQQFEQLGWQDNFSQNFNTQFIDLVQFWKNTKKLINNTLIPLIDIAFAVTEFSERSCDEFLQGFVGINNINEEIKKLGMNHTNNITYINSMVYAFTNYDNLTESQYIQKIQQMSYNELLQQAAIIHDALATQSNNKYIQQCPQSMKIWEMVVKFLYPSCSNDYAELFQKINEGSQFNQKTDSLLLNLFANSQFSNNTFYGHQFKKIGFKQGLLSWMKKDILTFGLYYTDFKGNQVSFALFFNQISPQDFNMLLSNQMNFILAISTSNLYLKQLINQLNN